MPNYAVLSVSELLAINEKLREYGARLRLRDACGAQSLSFEGVNEENLSKINELVGSELLKLGLKPRYYAGDSSSFGLEKTRS